MATRFTTGKTLLDIRKNFVAATGRYDLVQDTSSYADNGADFFIQQGSDFLDFSYHNLKSIQRYSFDILSGEYFWNIPNLIGIEDKGEYKEGGVWLSSSTGLKRLEGSNLGWMRDSFSRPVSGLTTAKPSYYAIVHSQLAESQQSLRLLESTPTSFNGTFNDATGWTISSGFSIANGKMTNDGVNAGSASFSTSLVVGKTYRVSFNISGMSTGSLTLKFGTPNTIASENGPHRVDLTITNNLLEITCTSDFDGSIDNIELRQVSNTYKGEFSWDFEDVDFSVGSDLTSMFKNVGLLLMSPSDSRYTVTVFGYFRSKTLSNNTDLNFWSVNHSSVLVIASTLILEMFYRNTQGQNDAMNSLRALISPVENMRILSKPFSRTMD